MDNEIARMIKYIVGGIPVDDETLMVDEIDEVGVRSATSCASTSTLRAHARAQPKAELLDRRVREDWEMRRRAPTCYHRCSRRRKELVEYAARCSPADDVKQRDARHRGRDRAARGRRLSAGLGTDGRVKGDPMADLELSSR